MAKQKTESFLNRVASFTSVGTVMTPNHERLGKVLSLDLAKMIFVRRLSVLEVEQAREKLNQDKTPYHLRVTQYYNYIVSTALVDEAGSSLFSPEDATKICYQFTLPQLTEIVDEIERMNFMFAYASDALKDMVGNSGGPPS